MQEIDQAEIKKRMEAKHRAELDDVGTITFEELERVFNKWLLIEDIGMIKFMIAIYLTNFFKRKAVWVMIIGPSGGGKTEFLNSLMRLNKIYSISTLTPNTLLSGMNGRKDNSLLPKINYHVLVMKDFTSIISMQRDARNEIVGQLREVWDGHISKDFGNGKHAEWRGKITLMAASTQAFDIFQQQVTHLGERFVLYRMIMPDRKEVAFRALNNEDNRDEMEWELQRSVYQYLKNFDLANLDENVTLTDEVKEELVELSDFCSQARSGIIRDFGPRKEVVFVPDAEMPSRIVQQLSTVALGLQVMGEVDMDVIYKIALDSIPATNMMVIMEMAKKDQRTTADISTSLGYPTAPVLVYLQNLSMLKVCYRIKGSDSDEGGTSDRWKLKPEFKKVIERHRKVGKVSDEEKKMSKENAEVEAEWEDEESFK